LTYRCPVGKLHGRKRREEKQRRVLDIVLDRTGRATNPLPRGKQDIKEKRRGRMFRGEIEHGTFQKIRKGKKDSKKGRVWDFHHPIEQVIPLKSLIRQNTK